MGGRFDCLIVALSCGMSCDFTLLGACGWASAWAESFGVGAEYMTERRDVHVVRIARIYRDGADHTRVVESDVGPGLARVGGLPHVVARRHVAAREWLAGAGVDHVRVQGRDREWQPRNDPMPRQANAFSAPAGYDADAPKAPPGPQPIRSITARKKKSCCGGVATRKRPTAGACTAPALL